MYDHGGFDPEKKETRTNSFKSKAYAIHHLIDKGCKTIALFTCPGPATPYEQQEEDSIRLANPNIYLAVYRYENQNPVVAEEFDLNWGCLLDTLEQYLLNEQITKGIYSGIVLEWDGTESLFKHLKNKQFQQAVNIINLCHEKGIEIVFCYTHNTRGGSIYSQVRIQYHSYIDG